MTNRFRAGGSLGSNYTFLTSKERDTETGLDYFLARYYSSTQGRFTSPDEFTGGPDELYSFVGDASENPTFYSDLRKPQSLNKYQYSYNNPLRYVDPDGHDPDDCPCWTPAKVDSLGKDIDWLINKVTTATGIAALADALRSAGPKVAEGAKKVVETIGENGYVTDGGMIYTPGTRQMREAEAEAKKGNTAEKTKSQDFTPSDKRKIDTKTSGNCADCGRETERVQNKSGVPTPSNQRQRHHEQPKSQGGTRDPANGVPLCPACHKERHRQIREIQADRKRQP